LQPLDAERVKEWRHRRMLSQQEVADRAGTSLFTIQRIERGEGNVRPKTGRRVAVALGVPIEELLPKVQAPLFRELPSEEAVEERRLQQGEARPELWQAGLAVLYREFAKKGRTVAELMKAGQLEDFTELVEFGKASAVLAKLRGPRDILGHEPDELAEAIDQFEAADHDIQTILRQELLEPLSEEQRQQLAEFRRRRGEISSAAEPKMRPEDAS
jgi:transcriptional regulator with XRE-family HTH domain